MKCETCYGRGFIELEHGLIMMECGLCNGTGEINVSDSGAESDNSIIGSPNTRKPRSPRKPKKSKGV